MEFLKHLNDVFPDLNGMVVMGFAAVLEVVLHAVPSEKPIGVLHMAAAALKLVGELMGKVGALIDKVIPQNIK